MHLALVISVVVLAVFARILIPVFNAALSPLRSVPGPFLARFGDFWYFNRARKGHFERVNIDLHRKYGTIVRYGPNRYSFSTREAQKTIYGHGTRFPKSSFYSAHKHPHPDLVTLFSDQNIIRHGENRRQYQSAYAMSTMIHYESYADECADLFGQRLKEIAATGMLADMGHWLQCYAFDVIGMITYSKRLGFLDAGEDIAGVIAALDDNFHYASLAGIYPWAHPFLFKVRDWLAGAQGAGRTYITKFTQERITEHEQDDRKAIPDDDLDAPEPSAATVDFLTKLISKNEKDPKIFTKYHVAMGCVSNMMAGSDTTAATLSATLYYLLKNPRSLEKLREEVDLRQKEHNTEFITFKESQDMPYLQAVIKEAMRLHPAVGVPLERVVPTGGATIDDRFFPEGTIVGINSWVSCYDTEVFGQDADEFKPERWLIDDKEHLSAMEHNWTPFGLGARTCLGRHVSILEMSKLIPMLVRDYDFELDRTIEAKHWDTRNFLFVKPANFRVKVSTRQNFD